MKALIDGDLLNWVYKICGKCDTLKALGDFADNPACRYGKAGTCKQCMAVNSNKHYQENRERKLALANKKNRERKEMAVQLLGGKCNDCSGIFDRCVYDFHHIDGSKDMNPSKALCMSWENAKKELAKCVLLCANCHRIRHFKEDLL